MCRFPFTFQCSICLRCTCCAVCHVQTQSFVSPYYMNSPFMFINTIPFIFMRLSYVVLPRFLQTRLHRFCIVRNRSSRDLPPPFACRFSYCSCIWWRCLFPKLFGGLLLFRASLVNVVVFVYLHAKLKFRTWAETTTSSLVPAAAEPIKPVLNGFVPRTDASEIGADDLGDKKSNIWE